MSATKLQGASLFLLICRQLQDSVVTGREDPSGRRTNASTFSLQRLIGGSPGTQPVGCGPPAPGGDARPRSRPALSTKVFESSAHHLAEDLRLLPTYQVPVGAGDGL